MKPIPTPLTSLTTIKMNEEECQTQARCSAKQQSDRPEQTPSEMVSQPEARMKARQAPMTSFTIKQSLEEQRTFINSHAAQAKKLWETANAHQCHLPHNHKRRRTRRNLEDPARPKNLQQTPQRPRNLMDIAKYFKHGQTSSRMPNNLTLEDNNTPLCQTSRADKLPILPSACTPTRQQMSGHAPNCA